MGGWVQLKCFLVIFAYINQNVSISNLTERRAIVMWYGLSLVTFYNKTCGFVDQLAIGERLIGSGVRSSDHCHCEEVVVVERLK